MTGIAHGDVDAVAEVQKAVVRFARDAEEVREAARRAADGVLLKLGEAVRDRRWAAEQARRAYEECQSHEGADCSPAAAALARAEERKRTAEQAFREAESAIAQFRPREQAFGQAVGELAREVVTLTQGQQHALEGYLAGGGGGGGFAGAPSGGAGGSSGGGAGGGSGPALPNGVQLIPLDLIDNPFGREIGPGDFGKGYSPEDLKWGFEALHEVVLPAVRAGKGADYFTERDQRAGLMGARSYHDTYTGFFGQNDAISLNPVPGGRYTIGNGQHRIWLARQMGLTSIPARIS